MLLSLPAMEDGRLENLEHMFRNLPEHIFRGLPIDCAEWMDEATSSECSATEMVKLFQQQSKALDATTNSLRSQMFAMTQVKERAKTLLEEIKHQLKAYTEGCQVLENRSKIFHEALERLAKLFALAKGLDEGWADYDKVMAQSDKLEDALSSMDMEPVTSEEMDNFRNDWEENSIEKMEVMMKVMKVKSAWEEKTQVVKEACASQAKEGKNEQVNEGGYKEFDEIKMWEAWYGPPAI
jgi:hypothetical protein